MVEGVVLEEHDVRCEKDILQAGMVYIAELYAVQCEEALLELGMEARGDDAGGGEAAGNGGLVKLAIEHTAIEVGVVGRTKDVAEEFTGEHEGKEGTRRGRGRVIVERTDDDIFHCELKAEERGEHCIAEEMDRVGRTGWMITYRHGGDGCRSFSTKRRLGRDEWLENATPTSRSVV